MSVAAQVLNNYKDLSQKYYVVLSRLITLWEHQYFML